MEGHVGLTGSGPVHHLQGRRLSANRVRPDLTVTQPAASGYTTVYPCLDGRPNASNNNYTSGQTTPDFVAAHPDTNGDICIYTRASAHLIWYQVTQTSSFAAHAARWIYDPRYPKGY